MGAKKTPKRTFYFMGEVLDTNMTPSVMEALLQQTADKFVGKKMVIVKVEMINAKTIKFTVHRNFSSESLMS